MVQGFAIPLLLGAAVEGLWGGLLMLPYPLHRPGVYLAKASYTPYGKTMVHTIAAVLFVGLFSPIWDAYRLAQHSRATVPETAATNLQVSDQEAKTELSAVLMVGVLGGLFVLRKLGSVMGDLYESDKNLEAVAEEIMDAVSEPSTPTRTEGDADAIAIQDRPFDPEETVVIAATEPVEAGKQVSLDQASSPDAGRGI